MSTKSHILSPSLSTGTMAPVTIRTATETDRAALLRLAQRDSARLPQGSLLVAESDGELRAAVAVADGRAVADPFRRTAELVALLRTRANQLRQARRQPLRLVARTPAATPLAVEQRQAA